MPGDGRAECPAYCIAGDRITPAPDLQQVPFQERILDHVLQSVSSADVKSAAILGADAAMIAALLAVLGLSAQSPLWVASWASAGSLLLVASMVCAAAAVAPRLKGPVGSTAYFGAIASRSSSDYLVAVRQRSVEAYLEDLALQSHRNAEIALAKHRLVTFATITLISGVGPWLVSLYFGVLG